MALWAVSAYRFRTAVYYNVFILYASISVGVWSALAYRSSGHSLSVRRPYSGGFGVYSPECVEGLFSEIRIPDLG